MPKGKTTYSNVLSVKNLAPQLWQLVPQSVKKCKALNEFKTITKMKKLNSKSYYPDHFPCKFWKTYTAQLGFIRSIHTSSYNRTRKLGNVYIYIYMYIYLSIYINIVLGTRFNIFTAWCNRVALVICVVVTIIFYMYYLILSVCLSTYVFYLTYYHQYYFDVEFFQTHRLIRAAIRIMDFLHLFSPFFTILSTWKKAFQSISIQAWSWY